MNNDLVKTKTDYKTSQAKYMERHLTLCVTLDKENDKDIITWLSKQKNKSKIVKTILREYVIGERNG